MSKKVQIKGQKFLTILVIFYIIMIFDNKLTFGMINNVSSSISSLLMNDSNSNSNNNNISNGTVKKQLKPLNDDTISSENVKNIKNSSNKDKNNVNPSVSVASYNIYKPINNSPTVTAVITQPSTTSTSLNDSISHMNMKSLEDLDIPNSFRIGFYIFIGLGVIAVLFISFKSYRLKLSRAERRYGVQGDRRAQELTPLPVSIEDESDTEDHTLFDIHKQIRIS